MLFSREAQGQPQRCLLCWCLLHPPCLQPPHRLLPLWLRSCLVPSESSCAQLKSLFTILHLWRRGLWMEQRQNGKFEKLWTNFGDPSVQSFQFTDRETDAQGRTILNDSGAEADLDLGLPVPSPGRFLCSTAELVLWQTRKSYQRRVLRWGTLCLQDIWQCLEAFLLFIAGKGCYQNLESKGHW